MRCTIDPVCCRLILTEPILVSVWHPVRCTIGSCLLQVDLRWIGHTCLGYAHPVHYTIGPVVTIAGQAPCAVNQAILVTSFRQKCVLYYRCPDLSPLVDLDSKTDQCHARFAHLVKQACVDLVSDLFGLWAVRLFLGLTPKETVPEQVWGEWVMYPFFRSWNCFRWRSNNVSMVF